MWKVNSTYGANFRSRPDVAGKSGKLVKSTQVYRCVWRVLVSALFLLGALAGITSAEAQTGPRRILVLGDSLSAGYGLAAEQAYPAVVQRMLRQQGVDITFINAGVSGDTASGGLERLDWALGDGVEGVIVELGANDMLRGLDPALTEKALDSILARLSERKIPVLIAGMIAAPGMGKSYEDGFNSIFKKLAEKHGALLYPFFLDGVAGQQKYLLADGMHPNPSGVEEMARRSLPSVLELIGRMNAK